MKKLKTKKFIFYDFGVKINRKIKWLNVYDYKHNAICSKKTLIGIGFKKDEVIIKPRIVLQTTIK